MAGFAVIDLETTGFAYSGADRVCEIGVVLLNANGERETTYGTLVNPQRDLGAQHVHGIDATDARVAPTFDRIVGDLTDLIAGRVIVAHNSVFDTAFLVAEYARAGWPLNLTPDMTLCTMRLAGVYGAPAKLSACCAHFGVPLTNAHAALADAEATASLLAAYMAASPDRSMWDHWVTFGEGVQWPTPPRLATLPVPRGAAGAGSELLATVAGQFERVEGLEGSDEYLDLLDRVLLDRKISVPERRALDGMAAALGLRADQIGRLNRHYMLGVVDAVCADDQLTRDERALVIQLAGLLDLEDLEVEALLRKAESGVAVVHGGLALETGDLIVLTGFPEARKAELKSIAEALGLVVWPNVKKSVAAVIALDEGSNSGKARKAREYGIPVVGARVLAQ
ncbi:exonuclease domain-containing protein [Demequina aurantiaca]|uniref:exonuclease domain-containing protein n=1 Tax=Demequina aurantiaca TaxID=676200 RepID=UPI003D3289CA